MENMEMINTVEETVGTDLMENAVSATPKGPITVKGILTSAGIVTATIITWEKGLKPAGKFLIRKIRERKQKKQAEKAIPAEPATDGIDPSEISDSELKIDD